ncbi:hypothetical protein HDU92_006344 [Lobulomyces angularis]|nr:hypothetical protein HDU92_006344 [Lobulomyces angularis]
MFFKNACFIPSQNKSFIYEISTEKSLSHFSTGKTPVTFPESNEALQDFKDYPNKTILHFHLLNRLFTTNLITLINFAPRRWIEAILENNPKGVFNKKIFFEFLSKTSPAVLNIMLAYGCYRTNHALLSDLEFGGSQTKASGFFLYKAIEGLKQFDENIKYQSDVLETMFSIGQLFYFLGIPNKGYMWLRQVGLAAERFSWDSEINNPLIYTEIEEKYLNKDDIRDRKILYTHLMIVSTIVGSPIGDDKHLLEMINQPLAVEMNRFTDEIGRSNLYSAENNKTVLQMCFLSRQVQKFCSNLNNLSQESDLNFSSMILTTNIHDLHDSMINWYNGLLSEKKSFDSLLDFVENFSLIIQKEWIKGIFNICLNVWWLTNFVKLHYDNYFKKKNVSTFSTVRNKEFLMLNSLELILLGTRAISSILLIDIPAEVENNIQIEPFNFGTTVDILIGYNLSEVIEINLEILRVFSSCPESSSWVGNIEIKKEVLNFHLKNIFFKVLEKRTNCPLSQNKHKHFKNVFENFIL